MKKLKKILALVIAMAMVLGMMSLSAFAEDGDGDSGTPAAVTPATGDGSITIKSPVLGAGYEGYRVFDMTMSESGDSYSYTIDTNSPFYEAVAAYANTKTNGLILTEIATEADGDYHVYNVSVATTEKPVEGYGNFDAQAFGQAMETAVTANKGSFAGVLYKPTYEDGESVITISTSDEVTIEDLPLGYYLILAGYPTAESTVTLGSTAEDAVEGIDKWTFTKDSNASQIEAGAQAYAESVVDATDYVKNYVTAHQEDFTDEEGNPLPYDSMTEEQQAKVRQDLIDSTKEKAISEVNAGINQIKGDESDINVQTQRLVFVDSTTPDVDIIEKNELDKWDVPVNPEGSAELKDLPEHGEPNGGKNIIVGYMKKDNGEDDLSKPIYADWAEANVGDSIHYQIRVNAMNFVREDNLPDNNNDGNPDHVKPEKNSEFDVKQVKEYVIADYQNDSLVFNPASDKIKVSIVDASGNVVTIDGVKQEFDYTDWHDKFFVDEENVNTSGSTVTNIMGANTGIVIPWAALTTDESVAKAHKNYTSYKLVNNAEAIESGEATDPEYTTYYWYNLYNSDVTIVVDYTMTLTKVATIDDPGNINYSQYGMNYTDKDSNTYNPPTPTDETPEPDETRDVDTATVKTYAPAIQKTDGSNELAGAKFTIKGATVEKKDDGFYKVLSYDPKSTTPSDELIADENGLLVVEGFKTSADLEITETEAPAGYNLLTAPVTLHAMQNGGTTVTTDATTTYYADKENKTAAGAVKSTTRKVEYFDTHNNLVAYKYIEIAVENGAEVEKVSYYNGNKEKLPDKTTFDALIANIVKDNTKTDVTTNIQTTSINEVKNNKGTELPSTGGIGTTIFYVIGTILVIGAGVVLITKRRMDA